MVQNLANMMDNRFHELEAFYDHVNSYYLGAEYGAQGINDDYRRVSRRRLFHQRLREKLLEIFQTACNDHYRHQLWYEYDGERNSIIGRENISLGLTTDGCLCTNYEERMILSESFHTPSFQSPEAIIQVSSDSSELSVMEVSPYHIIPLALISKFFQVWLEDKLDGVPVREDQYCLLTLIGRLRRSMQKLLIVQVRNSRGFSNEEWFTISSNFRSRSRVNFFPEMFRRANTWFSGNVFLGPTGRGPFNPDFGRNDEQLEFAFERRVLPIIGPTQYHKLFVIFSKLTLFVREAHRMSPVDRISSVFALFNSMTFLLSWFDVTPMKSEQWEERYPTDRDLRNISVTDELKAEIKNQKYWAIKQPNDRDPRSVSDYHYQVVEAAKKERISSKRQLKSAWNVLIENLMEISLDAQSQNKNLTWSCNLTKLYKDYLLNKSDTGDYKSVDCTVSFDEYLFSKISRSLNWRRCNSATNLTSTAWCQAWKRLKQHSNNDIDFFSMEQPDGSYIRKSWSESYLEDADMFMRWLSSEIGVQECKKVVPTLPKLPYKPYQPPDMTSNVIDTLLCYLTTIAINECNRLMLKS